MQIQGSFSIFILLLPAYYAIPTQNKQQSGTSQWLSSDDPRGLAAIQFLLKGAKLIIDQSPRAYILKRPGSEQTAISDFYALNPTNVRRVNEITETEIHGLVGKRKVALSFGKRRSSGKYLFPQITVTSFEPGKDPEYNFFMLVFWYMGDYGTGLREA